VKVRGVQRQRARLVLEQCDGGFLDPTRDGRMAGLVDPAVIVGVRRAVKNTELKHGAQNPQDV